MRIRTLPLAGIGLSFLSACDSTADIEGRWEGVSLFYDGVDVTEDEIYVTTYDDGCTYERTLHMVLNDAAAGGLFSISSFKCPDMDESYSYSFGTYLKFQYDNGNWSSKAGEDPIVCDPPSDDSLECDWHGLKLSFRKGT